MLDRNAARRILARDALEVPWFKQETWGPDPFVPTLTDLLTGRSAGVSSDTDDDDMLSPPYSSRRPVRARTSGSLKVEARRSLAGRSPRSGLASPLVGARPSARRPRRASTIGDALQAAARNRGAVVRAKSHEIAAKGHSPWFWSSKKASRSFKLPS